MATIFRFWFGMSLVAVADGITTMASFWADKGLRMCSRSRDDGYDFPGRLTPQVIKFETETITLVRPDEPDPLTAVL